ncbi:dienelactone hydrolase family protein [Thioalkalivibrio sulfidiphilus]|uniref:dienelactone hydrolase family protein n=1 Tax=Thioalkalivibrio sulfidiphilus TaxID=1033854 RepID=UPI00036B838A|nr:alpha/beta family hydrolase [Thioalkalivibrio sulfidiphilus]
MNIEHRELDIQAGTLSLPGILALPSPARGIVVFAHGSGSSRFSSRNRFVADLLNRAGLATLLFDLLSAEEHEVDQFTREYRFDIPRLGDRMTATVDWLKSQADLGVLSLGLFGASTGAAAALIAAAARPVEVAAVVSRGGRPDLAAASLPLVQAPTLFIVGGLDGPVIDLNRGAAGRLRCEHHMEIVPGATHLFEEPGTLEQAAGHARDWFVKYLSS